MSEERSSGLASAVLADFGEVVRRVDPQFERSLLIVAQPSRAGEPPRSVHWMARGDVVVAAPVPGWLDLAGALAQHAADSGCDCVCFLVTATGGGDRVVPVSAGTGIASLLEDSAAAGSLIADLFSWDG